MIPNKITLHPDTRAQSMKRIVASGRVVALVVLHLKKLGEVISHYKKMQPKMHSLAVVLRVRRTRRRREEELLKLHACIVILWRIYLFITLNICWRNSLYIRSSSSSSSTPSPPPSIWLFAQYLLALSVWLSVK